MNNKKELFEKLFNASRSQLYNVAYKVTFDHSDAEDVLQDAYIKAWNKFESYDEGRKFTNWMTTIVTNTGIDYKRKVNRKTANHMKVNSEDSEGASIDIRDTNLSSNPLQNILKNEVMADVMSIIDNLPNDYRSVMRYLAQGLSYDEISTKTKLPISSVRTKVHKAKKIMSERVSKIDFSVFN